jgi:hypothetical protein
MEAYYLRRSRALNEEQWLGRNRVMAIDMNGYAGHCGRAPRITWAAHRNLMKHHFLIHKDM